MEKIIQQGAEAIIILSKSPNGQGGQEVIIKRRIKKSYRITELDEKIRKLRTRSEGKLLEKASKIVSIPKIEKIDENTKEISMEFIKGKKLSDNLNEFSLEKQKKILKEIGNSVAKLHDSDIIHGDLTTSNMILSKEKVFLIDFGLGYISKKIEDRAVDIHLLKQALEARHFKEWKTLFKEFLKGYQIVNKKESKKVLERFKAVEQRGRYKDKY